MITDAWPFASCLKAHHRNLVSSLLLLRVRKGIFAQDSWVGTGGALRPTLGLEGRVIAQDEGRVTHLGLSGTSVTCVSRS